MISSGEFVIYLLDMFQSQADSELLIEKLKAEDIIAPDFEYRYLVNNVDLKFTLDQLDGQGPDNNDFYAEAQDGSPYRFQVHFNTEINKWQLKSFMFQCQGCFGEHEDCNVCGGSGWGVL